MKVFIVLASVLVMATNVFATDITRSLGRTTAPVVIEEYASLTCHACRAFQMAFYPKLVKEFIDKGKVRLVFHAYPLDNVAFIASILAFSIPKDQFFPFIEYLYFNQPTLKKSPQKTLDTWAEKLGFTIKNLVKNQKLIQAIKSDMDHAVKTIHIRGTPTLVIHAKNYRKQFDGLPPAQVFFTTLEKMYEKVK